MENYVAGQLAALGAAVALGAAGGLVYDLLRVLRRRRPGLTHAADAVFGLVCLLGALWALTRVGGGEPQLYLLLGAGAGMLLYLLAAAPLLRPLWEFWADVAGELARLLRKILHKDNQGRDQRSRPFCVLFIIFACFLAVEKEQSPDAELYGHGDPHAGEAEAPHQNQRASHADDPDAPQIQKTRHKRIARAAQSARRHDRHAVERFQGLCFCRC